MTTPRAFEDFEAGIDYDLGRRTVPAAEILAFAAEFDPQPMHLDPDAAQASPLGGLAGSGWHMTALMQRMLVDGLLAGSTSMGGAGYEHVTWHAPLRPDTTLTGTATILDKRISRSRPSMGLMRTRIVLKDAATGTMILEAIAMLICGVREPG